jgi:hypothetical protein
MAITTHGTLYRSHYFPSLLAIEIHYLLLGFEQLSLRIFPQLFLMLQPCPR